MVCWLDAAVAALHPTLKRCNFSHCKLQATLTRNIIENPQQQQQWNERDLLRQLLVVAAGKHILSKRTPSLFTLWQLGSPLTHDDRVCHCCCCNYSWSYQRDSFSLSVVETARLRGWGAKAPVVVLVGGMMKVVLCLAGFDMLMLPSRSLSGFPRCLSGRTKACSISGGFREESKLHFQGPLCKTYHSHAPNWLLCSY